MRSKWKGAIIPSKIFNILRNKRHTITENKEVQVYNKATFILNYNTSAKKKKNSRLSLLVYNGMQKTKMLMFPEMYYHKVGEFSKTRKKHVFRSKKKKI